MRALFTYFLIGLLLACPVLCRATDGGCCADQKATSEMPDEHRTPAPSDDAASCICGGAVNATDHRIHGSGPGSLSLAADTLLSDSLWLHHSALTLRHSRDGSPPEEAGWQCSRRVHALIQHFRC
ncbi:MAG: hypothetical protein WBX00_16410 [Isosphaeraceae bacterium]